MGHGFHLRFCEAMRETRHRALQHLLPGRGKPLRVTSAIVGFILGCLLQYQEYKKERTKRDAELLLEIETLEKIRRLEIENSEKIQKMKSDIDQTIIPQREKQIETLERIWNIKT